MYGWIEKQNGFPKIIPYLILQKADFILFGTRQKSKKNREKFVSNKLKHNLVETPRKFIIKKLSIRKLGSSSVLFTRLLKR